MPERFSEEEARQVFARAAERQHADESAPAGLSLSELQEIGQAAGLDPDHVAAAVAEVRGARPVAPSATFLGVDVEPSASRVIPGEVTDEAWGQMVGRVRLTFKTIGVTSDVGPVREWQGTNSSGGLSNLRMTAEPVDGGTRLVLETSKADAARQYRSIFAFSAAMAVLIAAMGLAKGDGGDLGFWVLVFGFALASVLLPLIGSRGQARWAERRRSQFDSLLDQFDLLARDPTPPTRDAPAESERGGAGRLDLDALDAPDTSREAAPRPRTRA